MRAAQCRALLLAVLSLGCVHLLWGGGPLVVGGPGFGIDGQPITWDVANPISYRTDGGNLGSMNNATAVARVRAMFDVWQNVPTASIAYHHAGALLAVTGFTDGDVNTASEYNAVRRSCQEGTQNPIVFDANGTLFSSLGMSSGVLGFAGPCLLLPNGRIGGGGAALNGGYLLNSSDPLREEKFDAAFIHEFGHFSGMDHAQINVNCISSSQCTAADRDGVPTMFPFLVGEHMKQLTQDDIAWISRLYPRQPQFGEEYGTVSGRIFFSDGVSQAQGVNVIARRLVDGVPSRAFAVSVVSGYRFTDNPGQPFSANYLACQPASDCPGGFAGNNTAGGTFGSREPALLGYYEMTLPPGQYTIEVEPLFAGFTGGSGVGPLDPPAPMPGVPEYWSLNESANDDPAEFDPVTVLPGQTTGDIDIILNGTPPRFDQFEDGSGALLLPPELWPRREQPGAPA